MFRVRQCFAKIKTTVLHKTAVLHITVVWFQPCLKSDMQNIFGSHMPKKTFLHTSHVPLLNWRRPETCKAKQKQFHLPRTFLQENHASCRSKHKKKRLFGFGCFHATCKKTKMNMLRGPSFQHELRPKWPLPVLCYTHRLLSS